jgi:hypothetical protein
LIIRLIERLVSMPPEELGSLSVQDIAVCKTWFDSYLGNVRGVEGGERIPDIVAQWLASAGPGALETEGRRHQTLLRELVDTLQREGAGGLEPDEIGLLNCVLELIHGAATPEHGRRLKELLAPYSAAIQERHAAARMEPGLPILSQKLHVVTTEDIEHAKPREIRVLAGVVAPSIGPVLVCQGHLRVLGDVPEDCTLVVEKGHCVVDGFVLGRVTATGYCEVRENIAGIVIVRNGDVRARNIINRATVISKCGHVFCRSVQSPDLVFAGVQIHVKGGTVQGRLVAPRMSVGEELFGGEVHVSELVRAGQFRQSKIRPLAIVFRNRLTAEDYGEDSGPRMKQLLSRALRLRNQITQLLRGVSLSEQEAEQYSANILMQVLGGDQLRSVLDEVVSAQRRLTVLNRIIMGLGVLCARIEERIDAATSRGKASQRRAQRADPAFEEIENEMKLLEEEAPTDQDLMDEQKRLLELRDRINVAGQSGVHLTSALLGIEQRLEQWAEEAEGLTQIVREKEPLARALTGRKEQAEEGPSMRQMLGRLVATAEQRPQNDPLAERMRSSFARLMLRQVHSRIKAAEKARAKVETLRADFRQVRDDLWSRYQVRLPEDETAPDTQARAQGRFEMGVKLYSSPHFLDCDEETTTKGILVTPDSGRSVVTYVRHPGRIVQAE